jgi:hypothetical protein
MKVFFSSGYPYDPHLNCTTTYLQESAKHDPFQKHLLVDNPEDADIIIFAEHHPDDYFFSVLKSAIFKKYKKKCYLYHDHDDSVTVIPTISPSIRAEDYSIYFHRPFSYIYQYEKNNYLDSYETEHEKKYLFSFIGAGRTNPIRSEILSLNCSNCFLLDTSDKSSWELSRQERDAYFHQYAIKSLESKFIICPAGQGPNSYRLYESLKMGIPPVIISDQWMPSAGPDWEKISIRIPESQIKNIPQILKEREDEAINMGKQSHEAWLEWFTKDKQFHLLTEAGSQLHSQRQQTPSWISIKQYLRLLKTPHFKNILRVIYKRIFR